MPPNLPPGTKSVMKRPADGTVNVRAGYDGPPMVPVRPNRFNDPAVQQAGGANADATTAAAGAANASKGPADAGDPAQAAAAAASELMNQARRRQRIRHSPADRQPCSNSSCASAQIAIDSSPSFAATGSCRPAQADYNWAIDEGARLDQVAAAKGLEAAVLGGASGGQGECTKRRSQRSPPNKNWPTCSHGRAPRTAAGSRFSARRTVSHLFRYALRRPGATGATRPSTAGCPSGWKRSNRTSPSKPHRRRSHAEDYGAKGRSI